MEMRCLKLVGGLEEGDNSKAQPTSQEDVSGLSYRTADRCSVLLKQPSTPHGMKRALARLREVQSGIPPSREFDNDVFIVHIPRKSGLSVDSSGLPFLMGKSCDMKSEAPPRLVELWLNSWRPGRIMQVLTSCQISTFEDAGF